MKYALRILGLLAIVFALYVIVGEQLVGSSGDAYVNARLSTVRAPIGGTVDLAPLALGARVQRGETMGSLDARDPADPTLAGLLEGDLLARADLAVYQEFAGQPVVSPLELERAKRRATAYATAVRERRAALAVESTATVIAPVGGVVWSLGSASGEYLPEGEILLSIADCSSLFIHATVDQGVFNGLSVGEVAQFRLQDGPIVDATVIQLAGTGPRTLWETFAINPSVRQLEGYAVLLTAPSVSSQGACPIGRTGRVVFSEGPLSVIGDFLSWMGL